MRFEVGSLQLFGLDIGSLAQRFRSGLEDIIPRALLDCFVRPAPTVEARIEQGQIQLVRCYPTEVDIAALQHNELALAADGVFKAELTKGVKTSQLQLHLVLPEEQVIRKRLTLPRAVRHNLRTVVGYQVGRLMPFSVDKVFFDVFEVPTPTVNNQTLEVELVAALKTEVQPWIEQVERLTGLTVSCLTVPTHDTLHQQKPVNLFAEQRTRNAWWLRLNRNSLLLFVLIAVLLATAAVPTMKMRSLLLERKHEINTLDERVMDLQEKRQILEQDLAALNYVLEQRNSSRELSNVIEELTRIVPNEIFITELKVRNQTVDFSGTGTGVVDLIGLLNSSPLFEDAKFTASIRRSGGGLDIFTASMQLSAAVGGQ